MTHKIVDLIVVGSGPAGLSAACEADKHGASVVLLDEQTMIGGQIYRNIEFSPADRKSILGKDYEAGQVLASEFRKSGVDYRGGSTVWNVTPEGEVNYTTEQNTSLECDDGHLQGRYVLLASGAMERPFPIKGWTLPGAMGAGAAQILLKGAGALPSGSIVLAGCGPLLYLLAWQYIRAGIKPTALVDTTNSLDYGKSLPYLLSALFGWKDLVKGIKLLASIRASGVPIYSGAKDLQIDGKNNVEALSFLQRGKRRQIPTNLVVLHQGVVPNTQLSMSTGAEHKWNNQQLCWQPVVDQWGHIANTNLYVAGDSKTIVGARASETQGRLAALSIASKLGKLDSLAEPAATYQNALKQQTSIRPFLDVLYRPKDASRIPKDGNVQICRCEEVTAAKIREYVALGCLGPNQTKSFGRCGMGLCQGRFCSLTVTEIIAKERNVLPAEVGHYRIRSPVKPILLGELGQQSKKIKP